MKTLVVCSGNNIRISPFVVDQVNALQQSGIEVHIFQIIGKGPLGYLKNYSPLIKKIKKLKPDIIHAHYGLCGFLCGFQNKIPVVVTYHGSDINTPGIYLFSKISMLLAKENIFVSKGLLKKSGLKQGSIIPCGIDFSVFRPYPKDLAVEKMRLNHNKKYILFSSDFNTSVKNPHLALKAVELLNDSNIELLELKNYSRAEVALLLNACDAALLTSFKEGSPQFIKEAMACNCPIVATDVGDIKDNIAGIPGCYLTSFNPREISEKLKEAIMFGRTSSELYVKRFDNNLTAVKLIELYKKAIL